MIIGSEGDAIMNLNAFATQLEDAFRKWAQLEPLAPCPQFLTAPGGPDRGQPRFGVAQVERSSVVSIDPSFKDVTAAVVLREIVRNFFPPSCLVDVVHDVINRFCGTFLAGITPEHFGPHGASLWQSLIKTHTRRYVVHYLGSPITLDLDMLPHGSAVFSFFRVFLEKLRHRAPLIPPDQVADIVTVLIRSIANSLWEHGYSPEDAEFITLIADYMGNHAAFPTPKRLAEGKRGWTLKMCEAAARRLREDPVSPTYLPNPSVLGLCFCWILIETPPGVSNYLIRHLTFLPFASLSFSQCVGAPIPTYFNLYMLAPSQLDELGGFFSDLKQKGVLLDYQIFRSQRFLDVVNWNECLAVSSLTNLVSETAIDLGSISHYSTGLAKSWPWSWFVQQTLPLFGIRKYGPRAMTHLDPMRNYESFLSVIEDAALLSTSDLAKDLAVAMPLLERYRNVEYVLRLLDFGMALLRHLFDHPEAANQGYKEFGKLELTWKYFPAQDWLMAHFHACADDNIRQAAILESLLLASRLLLFFAPFTIPPKISTGNYLREKQQALVTAIRNDLVQIPAGERDRLRYFTDLHNKIVSDHLIVPKISMSPFFHPSTEEFYFFARSSRPWEDLAAGFVSQFASQVHECFLLQFRDQVGSPVVSGIIRATHAQFRSVRRGLVGPKGVLGPGSSLLVGRRVPFWDILRRNYIETYDLTTQSYASIKEYLSLISYEHLAGWVRPRVTPLPYARKILSEPYLGPVEQTPRPPPNVVKLTPKIVPDLKESFLSGTSALHNLVEQRLGVRRSCDLNWPAYGLDRYFLHVYLSTRQPKYIFTHLITPATRRVLVSSAVSGFQTVLLEYLWPKGAPDDHFLQYLYSRTEKNVLAYSVHRVLSDARFFNLDKVGGQEDIGKLDSIDLKILMLVHPTNPVRFHVDEYYYGGDIKHASKSAGWEVALKYFSGSGKHESLPPDSRPTFEFDPRIVGFSEKVALVFRGQFDALPLCQSLPFGHYYRTEEIYHSSTERLVEQPGHIILFDFPALQMSQLNDFLDDLLRDPAVMTHSVASFLIEQNLALIQGVALARINPLRANPYDIAGGHYIHLPKRQLREGKWHTLSLLDQVKILNKGWSNKDLESF